MTAKEFFFNLEFKAGCDINKKLFAGYIVLQYFIWYKALILIVVNHMTGKEHFQYLDFRAHRETNQKLFAGQIVFVHLIL